MKNEHNNSKIPGFTQSAKIFNIVPQKTLNQLSQSMIKANGLDYQISICMEEISELATELILDSSFENTAAEIADVFITLNHVVVGYDIRHAVNALRDTKVAQPRFMSGNNERLLALLDLQKELMKHTNRGRNNLPLIIERTADAYVVLARLIISRNNFPQVRETINEKIERTYQRYK